MSILVLSPFLRDSPAIDLGNATWTKRLLPVGDVLYRDRVLHFTPQYLQRLKEAFDASAYSQVPFQLAGAGNEHTNDPERFRGEVTAMECKPDGLWITCSVTDAGNAVLSANPRLGISARIVEQYQRSDGQYFPEAVQHVLGTLDPRIPDLGPWQAADLSNDGDGPQVVDLSGLPYEDDDPGPGADEAAGLLLDGLSDAEVEELAAYIDGLSDDELAALEDEAGAYGDLSDEDAAALQELQAGQYTEQFANEYGDEGLAVGLANLSREYDFAVAQETVRASQQSARSHRRLPSAEVRLADALERIEMGTYTPQSALNFADGTEAGRTLAQLRWRQVAADPGICGTPDMFGRCGAMYHDMTCTSLADTELAGELRRDGTYESYAAAPFEDSRGTTWESQHGESMSLMDHVEAAMGLKLGDGLWETGRPQREALVARRQVRWADPDADEVPADMPLGVRAEAAVTALELGLDSTEAIEQRERYRQRRDAALASMAMRNGFRPGHPDYTGETPDQRANRVRLGQPFVLQAMKEETLPGELQVYTAG